MSPPGDRFIKQHVSGWGDKCWIVVDQKFQRDNAVRDWKQKGDARKRRIWRGTESDADSLAKLLNKAYRDDDKLITNVERAQSNFTPWARRGKVAGNSEFFRKGKSTSRTTPVSPFKRCACGARYKGDRHCDS